MMRFKRFAEISYTSTKSTLNSPTLFKPHNVFPIFHPSNTTSVRFLDFYELGSKDAIEKERARLKDEMSRGYFADMSDLKKHGGKIAIANQAIIPVATAVKFPALEVSYSDGKIIKLPVGSDGTVAVPSTTDIPKATLLCLSFRASSQAMVDSWSNPFHEAFREFSNIHMYEVSFVDSWFLSLSPIKRLLLRMMKKSSPTDKAGALQRQCVYSFGDHYYFRKELKILNLLTGYIFLLDKFGRVRWQGSGAATEEELASLLSCTTHLLNE
ncbi:hypothetical protein RND81_09G100500 [Saponaria officinalis]|uniref:AT1G08220-like protein n=1 Tax=Saponaria officinalis TaxID=3572 RepID=A0AAW1IKX4_SAPOF